MSSYYTSFNYKGINSKEKDLVVTHFADSADSGEMETFLNMEPVYTDNAYGTRRLDYGAKYSSVAVFRLTVIKQGGSEFSVVAIRDCLKWLTGSRTNSPLDLVESVSETFRYFSGSTEFTLSAPCYKITNVFVNGEKRTAGWVYNAQSRQLIITTNLNSGDNIEVVGDIIKYSFTGRVTNAWQYKMDARTVGLVLEFTSISPWAYSPPQIITQSVDGYRIIQIDNQSDDLYEYVYMKTTYENKSGDSLIITNETTGEITQIDNLAVNEIVTIDGNQMITSDKPNKIFGNSFNFVFPRLAAGINKLTITGTGNITFEYIMPLKIGDCAIDINSKSDPICDEHGNIQIDMLPWHRISDTPTTLNGYGITDAYTKSEISTMELRLSNRIGKNEDNIKSIDKMVSTLNSDSTVEGSVDNKISTTKTEIINKNIVPLDTRLSDVEDSIITLNGDSTTYGSVDFKINSAISGVYRAKGSCTFESLQAIAFPQIGDVYNISNEFTTTSSFIDGDGKKYPAGTNVVCVNSTIENASPYWDVLAGMVDLSNYTTILRAQVIADGKANNALATAKSYSDAQVEKINKKIKLDKIIVFDENGIPIYIADDTILDTGFAYKLINAKTVFIPSKVTAIVSGSFVDCNNITDVYIDNTDITISNDVFADTVSIHYNDSEEFANWSILNLIENALYTINSNAANGLLLEGDMLYLTHNGEVISDAVVLSITCGGSGTTVDINEASLNRMLSEVLV